MTRTDTSSTDFRLKKEKVKQKRHKEETSHAKILNQIISSDLFPTYPVFFCCLALTGNDDINE